MMPRTIYRLVSLMIVLLAAGTVVAQEQHFIYLQSENSQPFYVKLKDKVYSSTAAGYVILPKLDQGDYELNIGFPKNQFPEEQFHISIADDNQGYLLKNLNNNWSLFNMQTMALISGVSSAQQTPQVAEAAATYQSDPFSSLLADVIKDSSILRVNNHAPAETIKTEPAKETAQTSTTVAPEQKPVEKPAATAPEIPAEKPNEKPAEITSADFPAPADIMAGKIPEGKAADQPTSNTDPGAKATEPAVKIENPFVRILMVNEAGGQDMVYVNTRTGDTIRLFMPGQPGDTRPGKKPRARVVYQPEKKDTGDLTITPTVVTPPEKKAEQPKADDKAAQIIYNPQPSVTENKEENKPEETKQAEIVPMKGIHPDCSSMAGDKAFLKLRKRMAGEKNYVRMIDVARRFFKSDCYTTDQIRNLSYLFLDDEGRYQFFDAAYFHVSDPDQFPSLESQLSDPYYIKRFKAMIHK